MRINLGKGELCLSENQPLRLEAAAGIEIRCLEGTIWITISGQLADIFLHTGESYRIPDNGLALIEGASFGRITLKEQTA